MPRISAGQGLEQGALFEAHLRRHRISVAFRYGRKFGKSAGSAYPERTQVHAQMRLTAPACGARETHDVGVDGYPVANLERADVCTEVHDRSGELVPLYGRKDDRVSPANRLRSVPHIPQASTRMTTSPDPA